MSKSRRRFALVTLAASAAVLSGCAGGVDDSAESSGISDPEIAALYEAALKEGSVTWYTSAPNEAPAAFEAAYPGITVDFVRLPAGQLGTRYAQERESGAAPADLVAIADEGFANHARDSEWIDTDLSGLPSVENWPEDSLNDGLVILARAAYGIVYNEQLVDDPPTTWEDVLDPRFDGVIQNGDPSGVLGYMGLMSLLREEYGDQYLEKIRDMGVTYEASQLTVTQALAAGAKSLGMTGSYQMTQVLVDEGAPLVFQDMSPTTGSSYYTFVSTEPPHPNAAKLLLNFLMSPEGQNVFAADMSSPLGTEAAPDTIPLPDGWRDYSAEEVAAAGPEILKLLGLG